MDGNKETIKEIGSNILRGLASDVLAVEESAKLAAGGGKSAETLMNVVALIAKRFQTDVCSAYLLEPDRANLVLAELAIIVCFSLNIRTAGIASDAWASEANEMPSTFAGSGSDFDVIPVRSMLLSEGV